MSLRLPLAVALLNLAIIGISKFKGSQNRKPKNSIFKVFADLLDIAFEQVSQSALSLSLSNCLQISTSNRTKDLWYQNLMILTKKSFFPHFHSFFGNVYLNFLDLRPFLFTWGHVTAQPFIHWSWHFVPSFFLSLLRRGSLLQKFESHGEF